VRADIRAALAGGGGNLGLPPLKLGPTATPYEEQMQKNAQPYMPGTGSEYVPVTPFNTLTPPQYGANAPMPFGQRVMGRLATPY